MRYHDGEHAGSNARSTRTANRGRGWLCRRRP